MGLTNSQYDAIMRTYSEIQSENKRIQTLRQKEIALKIPEITAIESEISSSSMEYALSVLEDGSSKTSTLKELQNKIAALAQKKTDLLVANGYSSDYLNTIYTCKNCHDTGFVDGERCKCFKKALTDMFYSRSNAKNIRKNETFDTFSLDCYSKHNLDPSTGKSSYEHMKDVFTTVKKYVTSFDQADSIKNLLFYGETGLGKTFLSNCIANELINSCHSVIYLTAIELFQAYSKSEFGKDSETSEIVQEITDCDLLIIDDLGTELANSFTNSRLFYCINDRILKDKATIISTNLTLDKLFDQYSERIFSRIMHSYKSIKFYGDNIRLSHRLNKLS